jgi:hypothetical protein
MPQYVKICEIKFNCGDSNAMIRGDGYFRASAWQEIKYVFA